MRDKSLTGRRIEDDSVDTYIRKGGMKRYPEAVYVRLCALGDLLFKEGHIGVL